MTVDQLEPNQVQCGLDFPEPVELHAKRNPASELSIHGVEKTDETGRLCRPVAVRKDLAMHGLEGEIKHGGAGNCEVRSANDARRTPVSGSTAETRYSQLDTGTSQELERLLDEADQLVAITVASKKTARGDHGPKSEWRVSNAEWQANPPFNVNALDNTKCGVRSLKYETRPVRHSTFVIPRASGFNSSTPRSMKRAEPD